MMEMTHIPVNYNEEDIRCPQDQKDCRFQKSLQNFRELKGRVFGSVSSTYHVCEEFLTNQQKYIKAGAICIIILAFHVYLVFAGVHDISKARVIISITGIIWVYVILTEIVWPRYGEVIKQNLLLPCSRGGRRAWRIPGFQIAFYAVLILSLITFLVVDTWNDRRRLIGIGGIFFFLLLMIILSKNRRKVRPSQTVFNKMNFSIKWRPVIWGFALQFCLGLMVLRWRWGKRQFQKFSHLIVTFLDFTNNGTEFVYGFLAAPPNICGMSPVFFFTSLQVVIFFGSVVSVLYYIGIMQLILKKMAWFMQMTLSTTATESLNACACIFLGQSEAPLLIKPYLERMTSSELHAIMTSGFSCIAGSLFAAYIAFGACPTYLLSSTVMSAPGSLACSKVLFPETEESQLKDVRDLELPKGEESNALECISNGAVSAIELVAAIAANLIVFLALLAFIDSILSYFGGLIGYDGWSFELMLGYLFFPLAFVMGVTDDYQETLRVAQLMGTKTALNEFIAYQKLGEMVAHQPPLITPRSAMIATYALCGFSNFSSIGIQLGVLGGMVPSKKKVLAKIVLRALLAGCISCFFTATVAGKFLEINN
ncbi:unnamed protein product [Auanema sp. JU1783]|nr:unnamed protein product [Auanema sp. JU1783]